MDTLRAGNLVREEYGLHNSSPGMQRIASDFHLWRDMDIGGCLQDTELTDRETLNWDESFSFFLQFFVPSY